MKSPSEFTAVRGFPLKPSKFYRNLEVFVFLLLVSCTVVYAEDSGWMLYAVFLYLLMAWIYFKKFAGSFGFPPGCAVEIHTTTATLVWYDGKEPQRYMLGSECRVYSSRWFVMLNLKNESLRLDRLIFVDHFLSRTHYAQFRQLLLLLISRNHVETN